MTGGDIERALLALRGYADGMGLPVPATETFGTVSAILSSAPAAAAPPLLATDAEGCALLRWVGPGGSGLLALTVEGTTVHATVAPGSASRHERPFEWDGRWPSVIAGCLAGSRRDHGEAIAGGLTSQ